MPNFENFMVKSTQQLAFPINFRKALPFKKLFLAFSIVFVLNIHIFAQVWPWKPFSPKNQDWTILAPGPLKPDAEALDQGSKKGSYSYNDFYGFFAVIFRDSPRRFLPWKPDYSGYIKEVRDDVAKANKGEVIKDFEFSKNGVKGREAQVKFVSGTTRTGEGRIIPKYRIQRFRMFFVGRRFYVVLAVLPETDVDKPVIDKYFDSFTFNTAPIANPNTYSVDEDTTLTVAANTGVLANDTDAEKNKLAVSAFETITNAQHGSLKLNSDGSFVYKPAPDFYGTDSFTYEANDGLNDSLPATVTINVRPVNDAPTIAGVPSSQTVDELAPFSFTPTANDIDSPAGLLRFSLKGGPSGASIDPKSGRLSWTPAEEQGPGTYNFEVCVTDSQLTTCAPSSVAVREVNVAPRFANASVSSTINELEPYSFNAQAIDTDLPKQNLTYSLAGASNGATINSTTGAITWTPTEAQGDNSSYKFTVQVSDGIASAQLPVNLTVREVNSAPSLTAIPDQNIDELKTLSITARGTDVDLPANNLTYSLDAGAPAGLIINPTTGDISWTPDEAQGTGDYSVIVRLTDNGAPTLSDSKTFRVHVNEVNVAPKINSISNKTVDEETPLNFTVQATDTDLPANTLTFTMTGAPSGANLNASTGAFIWTPTEAQGAGTYTITFHVTDNGTPALSDQQTVTITVNEVNKPPVAENNSISLDEDASATVNLKAADSDLPANTMNYSVVSAPAHGKLSGTGANLTYQPNPDFNGSDSFTFKANDGTANSNIATVTINVRPVNDSPIAKPDNASTSNKVPVDINVLANDSDIDGDKLVLSSVSNAVNGKTEIVNGQVRFTPNPQFQGTAGFSYTISDGHGGTATGKVTVTVTR